MFNYTVTKVESHQITVEFPDSSWAEVPVFEGESKEVIDLRVADFYHPTTEGFDAVSEVPFKEGKTYSTEEVSHKPENDPTNSHHGILYHHRRDNV